MEKRWPIALLWAAALVMCVAVSILAAVSAPSLLADGVHYVEQSAPVISASSVSSDTAERISINTADKETLMTLSGIGEALAQRIIDYREVYGPFATVDDLLNVEGIGEKRLAAIREQITV